MYQISPSLRFIRQSKDLVKKDERCRKKIAKCLRLLANSINYPSLRLHKLSCRKTYSISVDNSMRIILKINKDKIYLLEIGSHDQVY